MSRRVQGVMGKIPQNSAGLAEFGSGNRWSTNLRWARRSECQQPSSLLIGTPKGVFGCNLELFQSDVDPCFLPAEKDAFV